MLAPVMSHAIGLAIIESERKTCPFRSSPCLQHLAYLILDSMPILNNQRD